MTSTHKSLDLTAKVHRIIFNVLGCLDGILDLHRSIALILCFCLIGVTAVPAAYLPCCCKASCKSAMNEQVRPCCKNHQVHDQASAPKPKARPCCAMGTQVALTTGTCQFSESGEACPSKVVKQCPFCRCLEQMQIVALSSGSTLFETVTRVPDVAWASAVEVQPMVTARLSEFGPTYQSHSSSISLLTCTLRC